MKHLTSELIDRYRSGAIDPVRELPEVETHLSACVTCRDALLQAAGAAIPALGRRLATTGLETGCLEEDMLSTYVDGRAGAIDREWIESHLEGCARCRTEVNDLRAWRGTLPTRPRIAHPSRRLGRVALAACAAAVIAGLGFYAGFAIPPRQEGRSQESRVRGQESRDAAGTARITERPPRGSSPGTREGGAGVNDSAGKPEAVAPDVATLRDGKRRITLRPDGNLSGIEDFPREARQAIRMALRTGRVPVDPALQSGPARGKLLSPSEAPSLRVISPAGTAVRNGRPEFRWMRQQAPAEYRVHVVDDARNEEVVASSPLRIEGSTMAWRLPEDAAPLPPGRVYRWYVEATRPDGSVINSPGADEPAVRFRVPDEKTLAMIRRLEASGSTLAAGLLYARVGLMEEGKQSLQQFANENPKSALAQRLLRSAKGNP